MEEKTCKYCGTTLEKEQELQSGVCSFCQKRKDSITESKRRTVFADLKKFDYFAHEGDFIELTEWTNGEGADLCISEGKNGEKYIPLTYGMLEALVNLAHRLVDIPVYKVGL